MTLARLRGQRALPASHTEDRSLTTFSGGVGGYQIMDPSAIPPPGMGPGGQMAGVNVNTHTALAVEAAFACLRIISTGVGELGEPYSYTEELDADNYPYRVRVKNQPNILAHTFAGVLQTVGMRQTVTSMALFGESFWYVLDREGIYPTAIDVINPARLQRVITKGQLGYRYNNGEQWIDLDPANVIHIPHMSLPGAARGLSSIEFLRINYGLALAAAEYGSRWFEQGASPSYILSTKSKLNRDDIERIADKFQIEHSGLPMAHLPLVVDNGLEVQQIQSTPDQAQFLQTLEYQRQCIASWFGVPATLIGNSLMRQTPAPPQTLQQENMRFIQWTLSAYIRTLEEVYSNMLPGNVKVAFNRHRLLQADDVSLAQLLMAVAQSNTLTPNEIRVRYLNEAPHRDGDQLITPLASNTDQDAQTPDAFPNDDTDNSPSTPR